MADEVIHDPQGKLVKIATFHASLPLVSKAASVSGEGNSRLQFDVPLSELDEVVKFLKNGREKLLYLAVFEVTQ